VYTANEVAKHNKRGDCWIIFNQMVYDVSDYFEDHPGGPTALLNFAGKDGTANLEFHSASMMTIAARYCIGRLDTYKDPSCTIL